MWDISLGTFPQPIIHLLQQVGLHLPPEVLVIHDQLENLLVQVHSVNERAFEYIFKAEREILHSVALSLL